jgi:hypothetical protein
VWLTSVSGAPTGATPRTSASSSSTSPSPWTGGESGIGHGLTDLFLFLQNVPSELHGGACGGDSGSPVFLGDTSQFVAVHTGGYRLGSTGAMCGRLTSLNHRLDTTAALDWIYSILAHFG